MISFILKNTELLEIILDKKYSFCEFILYIKNKKNKITNIKQLNNIISIANDSPSK